MGKFRKNRKSENQTISTSSLPDIVFMLLFFFMVTTVMRETTINVKQNLPTATEVKKLEKKFHPAIDVVLYKTNENFCF